MLLCLFVFLALQPIVGVFSQALASSFSRFLDHTQRRATVGRTPLDEWSIRRKDLYLTTHNTHNRQTSMPPVGFESTISAGERPKTYALDRAAPGTVRCCYVRSIIIITFDYCGDSPSFLVFTMFYVLHSAFTFRVLCVRFVNPCLSFQNPCCFRLCWCQCFPFLNLRDSIFG
jgi:hypothetical protein